MKVADFSAPDGEWGNYQGLRTHRLQLRGLGVAGRVYQVDLGDLRLVLQMFFPLNSSVGYSTESNVAK